MGVSGSSLQGKGVLGTGGSSGIGKAFAIEAAKVHDPVTHADY